MVSRFRFTRVLCALLLIQITLIFNANGAELETGFVPLSTEVDGQKRAGAVWLPEDYDPSKKYPLIVFLHGSGEKGTDGVRQTEVGIGKAIRQNPERFPCLVYMPQSHPQGNWGGRPSGDGTSAHDHITAGIDTLLSEYSIDKKRISMTGLSMGGMGTFTYGAQNAKRLSAFMPICGRGSKSFAKELAKRPIWIFHGDADRVVPIGGSEMMAKSIRAEGGDVQFTIYPGVGHNSWDRAYAESQGAVEWLLEQRK